MNKRMVVTVLNLLVSAVIGIGASQIFYSQFRGAIPDALRATTSMRGTWVIFTAWGIGLGLVVFLWALAVGALARLSPSSADPTTPPTGR